MDEQNFKETVAKNIAAYRKALNLTQAELAQKLNYSDKAVSKWERAEGLPDAYVLKQIADIYGVTLDELARNHGNKKIRRPRKFFQKKIIVPLLSVCLVWVIATNVFAIMFMAGIHSAWIAFLVAVPVSLIVFLVFSILWWRPLLTFFFVSGLVWSIAAILYILITVEYNYLFFIIAVPLQILEILWSILRKPPSKKTKIQAPLKKPEPESEKPE